MNYDLFVQLKCTKHVLKVLGNMHYWEPVKSVFPVNISQEDPAAILACTLKSGMLFKDERDEIKPKKFNDLSNKEI